MKVIDSPRSNLEMILTEFVCLPTERKTKGKKILFLSTTLSCFLCLGETGEPNKHFGLKLQLWGVEELHVTWPLVFGLMCINSITVAATRTWVSVPGHLLKYPCFLMSQCKWGNMIRNRSRDCSSREKLHAREQAWTSESREKPQSVGSAGAWQFIGCLHNTALIESELCVCFVLGWDLAKTVILAYIAQVKS